MATKWKPLDEKAIAWWADQNNAKPQPPFAWPQVTYLMPDGTIQRKIITILRIRYLAWRKENSSRKREKR